VPTAGRDYETSARITLEDAHRGTKVQLELAGDEGSRTLEVTIPPGVMQGQKLRLRGKGGKGRHGGPDGDIYLHITLLPHAVFRVDQHDLSFDLALSPWEAALGADVEVPSLEGPIILTVPPGTQSGRRLRLRNRGLARGHEGRGDLYAVVRIATPLTLTGRERELFTQLAEVSLFNPRTTTPKEPSHADTNP
jgi:curved DNA-binding protein